LAGDIGATIAAASDLTSMLQLCARALAAHLGVAYSAIWTMEEREKVLAMRACAGRYSLVEGKQRQIPLGAFRVAALAQERRPYLTNDLQNDPWLSDRDWARSERLVGFAGYPLVVEGQLAGVMAIFAREALEAKALESLGTVADAIATGIARKRLDEERATLASRERQAHAEADAERARLRSFFMQAPVPIALVTGPDHVFELANPPFLEMVGGRDLIGKPVREALPELPGAPLLDRAFRGGEPILDSEHSLMLNRGGNVREAIFRVTLDPWRDAAGAVQGVMIVAVEITDTVVRQREMQARAASLIEEQQWLQTLLDFLPVPVLMIEPITGSVLFANKAADRVLEGTKAGASMTVSEARPETSGTTRIPHELHPVVRAACGENLRGVEIEWSDPAGNRSLLVGSERLEAAHGHPATIVLAFEDVTEQQRTAEMRERLLGIVGHDLRNPLSAIVMAATMLRQDRHLSADQARTASRILSSGERMDRIIRDLLDVTKVRLGGGISVSRKPTDAHALCRQMVEELRAANPHRKIRLVKKGDGAGSWDAGRLEQVVSNLLANALQYGPRDAVVTVMSSGAAGEWVLSVHNFGDPIPAAVFPHIFDPFRRGADAAASEHDRLNLGLGLFIVRELVRAHGGTIAVTSNPREGTRFVVRLARDAPPTA
jgi:signal transduction histidine kinase